MAAGDLLRVNVNQSLQSSIVQNVLYYTVESDDPGGNEQALFTELAADVLTPWSTAVTEDLSIDCVEIQKEFPAPLAVAQEFNVGFAGLRALQSLPAMDSGLIQKFNPTVTGVGKKGRVYIAGMAEDDQELGRFTVAGAVFLAIIQSALEVLLTSAGGGQYKPAWAVRDPNAPFSITGFVTDLVFKALPRFATIRNRRTPVRSTV